jgi:DNA-binding MarR family transcriptional regulator
MSSTPTRPTPRRRPGAKRKISSGGSSRSAQASRAALELQTLQAFRLLFGTARRHDAEVRRMAEISGSQLWALSEIARSQALSVNDLAERMALHQTTASNLVNALAEEKLIRRVRDTADQRVVRLHVTTEGKRKLLRAPGPYTGLLVDALRHLDTEELGRLNKSLGVLTAVMRNAAIDAAGETLMGE